MNDRCEEANKGIFITSHYIAPKLLALLPKTRRWYVTNIIKLNVHKIMFLCSEKQNQYAAPVNNVVR